MDIIFSILNDIFTYKIQSVNLIKILEEAKKLSKKFHKFRK